MRQCAFFYENSEHGRGGSYFAGKSFDISFQGGERFVGEQCSQGNSPKYFLFQNFERIRKFYTIFFQKFYFILCICTYIFV
jgi:hypothetical protein